MSSTPEDPARTEALEDPGRTDTREDPGPEDPGPEDPGPEDRGRTDSREQPGRTEPGRTDTGDGGSQEKTGKPTQLLGLGAFIRGQRRLADMSLREMANLTSVSNAYLSQIERGLHQPSLRVLRSIAQALRIAPEDLLRRANFLSPGDAEPPASEPPPPDTEAAILSDPRLTPAQRDALLNVYRSFLNPA